MKRRFLFGGSAALWVAGTFALACGDDADNGAGEDAGNDASVDAAADVVGSENVLPPETDASTKSCTLDDGDDPVLLCTQKFVLKAVHEAAFLTTKGVLTSWDSTTQIPDVDGTGAPLHDLHDDAAYAAACSTYTASASRYGDTELTQTLDLDLVALIPILTAELTTLPPEYAGDLYQNLRTAAGGLRVLNHNADADAIDAIAEKIGAAILGHFIALSTTSLDAGDDGGDAGAGDGGAAATDAGDGGALPSGDGVLSGDGTDKDYAPADVATGSLALLDMAMRHAATDPTHALLYTSAAQQSLDHIYLRARDATTHRYLRLLVPGVGPATDDVSLRTPFPQDLLATETTAGVALALLRAQNLVSLPANAKLAPAILLASYPFLSRANEAIAALNGTPTLYDADKFGYFEGYVPSSGKVLTNKPTRANMLVFAALHIADMLGVSPYGPQAKDIRTMVSARTPLGAGLLSASNGQTAYFASVTQDFNTPPATYALDGGPPTTLVPHPNSYVSAAVFSAANAFDGEWIGYP